MAATMLNPKETAKVIRTVLKKAFPETTFKVTTGRGAGVSSVDLSWMDGPTTKEVDAIVGAFEMGRFNGMTDSYDYDSKEDRQLLVDGVHYEAGCRYVMTQRRCSAEFARKAVALLVEYWGGVEYVPEIIEQTSGGWWFANSSDANKSVREDLAKGGAHYDWQSQIHQALSDPSRFVREVVTVEAPATSVADLFRESEQSGEFAAKLERTAEDNARSHAERSRAERTWTEHTAKCTSCGDLFRVSQEMLDEMRANFDLDGQSDAEIAKTLEFCFECVDGILYEREKSGLNNDAPAPSKVNYADLRREDIQSLDQALYVASCFAGNSKTSEVAILCKIVGDKENYAVLDTPLSTFRNAKGRDMLADGWSVVFVLRKPRANNA